ncbi:MAG TPA: response regulator, partial [Candidatus Caenarcaniphilales bacterium]
MEPQLKVLLVEDNPGDVRLLEALLAEVTSVPLELTQVEQLSHAGQRLSQGSFDVVLLDLSLPDSQGLETFIKLQSQFRNVPVVVLTGLDDEMLALKAVQAGAQDYLSKGQVTGELLVRSMRYAIERKRSEEVLRQQIEQERLVAQIAQRIRQSLNLEEILNTTVSEIRQFLQSDRVFIYRFEPGWGGVVVVESVGSDWKAILGKTLKDPSFAETYVPSYKQGRIQATADIDAAALTPCYVDFLAQMQVKATLVVPILQGERLWGLLVANHCEAPRQWQPLEINLLKQLATQLAIALQQSELYQQVQTELNERKQAQERLRARAQQQAAVSKLGQQALSGVDLSLLMNEAVVLITQGLEVEYCQILELLGDRNTLLLRAGVGWHSGHVGHTTVSSDQDSQAGYTLMAVEPVIFTDLGTESRFSGPPHLSEHGVVSGLNVVIPGHDRPFGILGAYTTKRRTFTQDDTHFLQVIANILATAIERKSTEQKIREQAALLNITTDAIVVRDLDNHLLFWNKGAEQLYGWEAEEVLGKHATQLLHQEISSQIKDAQVQVIETGEWQGELEQITKAGQEIIVASRWSLVRDAQEQPKAILAVNTDITEKKNLEAQFLRAQRMESIGILAGGIAHDLNNILAPILMAVQLLEKKLHDQQSQRLLKTLETNTKRGADLIKQVLSFARGLEGKRTLLQLRHLILEIKQIAQETFPRSIEISIDLPPDLWTLSGDATQLHQVLMNLCVNARDAMPEGGTLSITAENLWIDQHYTRMNLEARVGSYIVITVADTGSGIPPEIVDRIFEPFFTTKEIGKGTGLGLSTVIGIIKSHGGFVKVHSKVGRGTDFKVYLPAVEGTVTRQPDNLELATGQGELILVVDDEAAVREVTKTTLETYNYKVITTSDGIEAVAVYAQHWQEISVVLSDMLMPAMDGATTIRTLAKINPQVKIVAVSGLAANDKVAEAASTSVKAFLTKPYTASELLKTLQRVLHT